MTIPELYAAIDGNYASVKRILPMDTLVAKFIVRLLSDKNFERLMQAKENHDPTELFEAAHALKGICANLGLDNLSAMASLITEEFRPGKPRTMSDIDLDAHFEALREKYTKSIEVIEKFAAQS